MPIVAYFFIIHEIAQSPIISADTRKSVCHQVDQPVIRPKHFFAFLSALLVLRSNLPTIGNWKQSKEKGEHDNLFRGVWIERSATAFIATTILSGRSQFCRSSKSLMSRTALNHLVWSRRQLEINISGVVCCRRRCSSSQLGAMLKRISDWCKLPLNCTPLS